jgi:Flp pilus assembly protein TadG
MKMRSTGGKKKRIFRGESGQSMVELAVALPLLLLVVFGIIDFGWLFYNKMGVENASREGARYAIVNSASGTLNADVTALAREYCMGTAADTAVTVSISGVNATVTVNKNVKVLTPLAGIFVGGQVMPMTSTTKMRIK